MAHKPITKNEAVKLNKAVETLLNFCEARSSCYGCPFSNEVFCGDACKFGYFYPALWNELKIQQDEPESKETERHE